MLAEAQDMTSDLQIASPRPTRSERPILIVSLVAVGLTACVLDQLTKWIASAALVAGGRSELIPGLLDFRLRANPNGAFGLFANFPDGLRLPILLALAVLAMAAISIYAIRTLGLSRSVSVALGLVLGGAVANLIDRVAHGEVIDFIHLHWANRAHWPTFNVADMAITAGSLLLAVTIVRIWNKKRKLEQPELDNSEF
jgi:signal peptidase II